MRVHHKLFLPIFLFILVGCMNHESTAVTFHPQKELSEHLAKSSAISSFTNQHPLDLTIYEHQKPTEWGEFISGVKTKMETNEKAMALTFDACGGEHGSLYDEALMNYLIDHQIPATLFVNARWIKSNEPLFLELAENPLFQIENHGTEHKPLSVSGKSAWGIDGTKSIEDAYEEVLVNHNLITELTGVEPTMFRPGTAFFDNIAVKLLDDLEIEAVNYSILGDAGATFTPEQVTNALVDHAEHGAIALLHMNQPSSGTAEGVKQAIPLLMEAGYTFVRLSEFPLK